MIAEPVNYYQKLNLACHFAHAVDVAKFYHTVRLVAFDLDRHTS